MVNKKQGLSLQWLVLFFLGLVVIGFWMQRPHKNSWESSTTNPPAAVPEQKDAAMPVPMMEVQNENPPSGAENLLKQKTSDGKHGENSNASNSNNPSNAPVTANPMPTQQQLTAH